MVIRNKTGDLFAEIKSLSSQEDGEYEYSVVSPFGETYNIKIVENEEAFLSHCGYASYSHAEGYATNALR